MAFFFFCDVGNPCNIAAGIITITGPFMDKTVLSARDLLEDSFQLGVKILESGFEPTLIIAIWRGGTPVGMAVQEVLSYCGVESDHIAIRTSSYTGVDERGAVVVHGLNYMIKKIRHDDRVLIIDDVFDTGNTIKAVVEETDMVPDFYLRETAEWLVFPHELDALTTEEMSEARPELHAIIQAASA
jgi:hypoxanthine phosphoribosyltransferase